jgi:hypothetical protein
MAFVFTVTNFDDKLISTNTSSSRLSDFNDKGSSRPLLWLTGLYAVTSNPFGVSPNQYEHVKIEMYKATGVGSLRYNPCHNGFINTGFNYSIFGYLAMTLFLIFIFSYIKKSEKPFSTLFILFLIGYFIHSSFHNNFIFYSDYDVLMVLILIGVHPEYQIKSKSDLEK